MTRDSKATAFARADELLEQLPMPLMLATPEGGFSYWNRAAEELLGGGIDHGASVVERIALWLNGPDAAAIPLAQRCQRLQAWEQAGACPPLPLSDLGRPGHELSCHPLGALGVLWSIDHASRAQCLESAPLQTTDSLERRVMERTQALDDARLAAERAHLSKTRFFAAASHDLLQPLNAARIFASTLAEQDDLSDTTRRIAERIDASLRTAEEVIDVLVDVAKLDTGAVRAVPEDIDLNDLLRSLCEQFSPISERRNLRLRSLPCRYIVRSDRRLLRRVMQNLISNALRYTKTGGVLVGARRLADGRLRIDVIDTGLGIPEESLPLAFQEFQRIGRGSPWGEKGLGLGLAICDRICALLGHQLTAVSRVGNGSRFSVALMPGWLRSVNSQVQPLKSSAAPRLALDVLCVDDDADVLDAMMTMVGSWGATVAGARSLRAALEHSAASPPAALLVDYQFDDDLAINGLDVIGALRALHPEQPPAAFLITANRSDDVKTQAQQLGVVVLQKPLRAARLRSLLEAVVRDGQ